jgi:predicted amidohydrolase YtcJ
VPAVSQEVREPTLILHGGEVVTLDAAQRKASAVAIEGDRIRAVGMDKEILALRGPATKVVSLSGKVVLPSFKEHHTHLLWVGVPRVNTQRGGDLFLDLSGLGPDEVAARIATKAATLPRGTWIVGRGLQTRGWETRFPTHDRISAVTPNHPVVVGGFHSILVNAEAMRLAGISADTPEPSDGIIMRDAQGKPTGFLLETGAMDYVMRVLPDILPDQVIKDAMRDATNLFASLGTTAVYDPGFVPAPIAATASKVPHERYVRLTAELDRAEPLPIDVNVMFMAPSASADALLKNPAAFRQLSPRVNVVGIKMWADATAGYSFMTHPDAEHPEEGFGKLTLGPTQMLHWALRAVDAGLDVRIHAMADGSVRHALDVYEAILKIRPKVDPSRLEITHYTYVTEADIDRTARLGIGVVSQPAFARPNMEGTHNETTRFGRENMQRHYPFRMLEQKGIPLWITNDTSLNNNLFHAMYHAVTRKAGPGGKPYHPENGLSRASALKMMTDLRLPHGQGVRPGAVREGSVADLMVVSANPLTVTEDAILDIKFHATIKEGRITFAADPAFDALKTR